MHDDHREFKNRLYAQFARVGKALASAHRLELLELLGQGERTVDSLARELGVGFVPARKPGKLPGETVSAEYILEYGVDALEMHADALAHGARVLLHDDLLATGGTAAALVDLVRGRGAEVAGFGFLVELSFLGGRAKLDGIDVETLIAYSGE